MQRPSNARHVDPLKRALCGSVALLFLVGAATLALPATIAGAGSASISQVVFTSKAANPTITVTGTGFGSIPSSSSAGCGTKGSDFAGDGLYLQDTTQGWTAGKTSNCIGLVVSSFTETSIVFKFGKGYYDTSPTLDVLAAQSRFQLGVNGTTFVGTVGYGSQGPLQVLMGSTWTMAGPLNTGNWCENTYFGAGMTFTTLNSDAGYYSGGGKTIVETWTTGTHAGMTFTGKWSKRYGGYVGNLGGGYSGKNALEHFFSYGC